MPDTSATAEQAYALIAGTNLPGSVTNIECHGAFWMDHNFSLRFNASDSDIEQILSAGYTATDWESIEHDLVNPLYLDHFTGPWRPAEIENKSCYELETTTSDYWQCHLLVIDHASNLVYCVSSGSVSLDTEAAFGEGESNRGFE